MSSTFNTSLLREKFVIRDVLPESNTGDNLEPVVALSNRLVLPLVSDNGKFKETFVVRAQNMHTCARFGAQIAREFQEKGPIMDRARPFSWAQAYHAVTKGYEEDWNPNRWVAIYHNGRAVFEEGEQDRHPFLDIIEQCESRNQSTYETAVNYAEDAFKQAGKLVTISHDSNVALIVSITQEEGKCGVILRGPDKTTTFNFTAKKRADRLVQPSQCLTAAAAFLEGIQLAFYVGMTQQKILYELVSKDSDDAKQCDQATKRIGRLNTAISQFENILDVNFRPDRPNFSKMVSEAEDLAKKILSVEIQKKIDSGEEDAKDWVL